MTDAKELLVVFFHGVGSNGADLARIGAIWEKSFPNLKYVAPNGIMAGPNGHGRAWFSIAGVTDQNRPDRIEASRHAFDDLLKTVISDAGFAQRLDRVVFVGFSQGAMMALDAAVSGRWPVAAVLSYSGRLATHLPFEVTSTRIRLVHGDADPVIPVNETRRADEILRAAGFAVETTIQSGIGHTISAEGLEIGRRLIADLIEAP